MSQSVSPSSGKPYRLARVLRIWELPRSSDYFSQRRDRLALPTLRRGPKPAWTDERAQLRFAGVRTSPRRVLRLLRAANLLSPTRLPQAPPQEHKGSITTDAPNLMWGTDFTLAVTLDDGQVAVFAALDHCNSQWVGIHAAVRATRFEALEPIRQGVREQFGNFIAEIAAGLKLRHDHGSQDMSDDFQTEIDFLGMESSPAFVRQPEGNGCIERFFRTLKEQLLWVRTFRNVEELRPALIAFRHAYNQYWLVGRLGYRSPLAFPNALQAAAAPA